mmetsp:Transcript_32126/g.55478  ORF Transcript_32126/g.55478 Transcript_32126/m.55478 type:complete len:508 (+) Transcript_32126:1223-2746(+)
MDKFSNSSLTTLKAHLKEAHILHATLKDLLEISANPPTSRSSRSSKLSSDSTTTEEISRVIRKLYKNDQSLSTEVKHVEEKLARTEGKLISFKHIKSNLASIKATLETEGKEMRHKCSAITKVLNEFRARCKRAFEESLKDIDHELRKLLLPLVPSDTLCESIGFKPINPDSSLLSTKGVKEVFEHKAGKSRSEMLLEAIEKTAEGMLSILKQVTYTYWKNFDPSALEGFLTPLSETLPECFLYDVSSDTQKETQKQDSSKYSKQNLLTKIRMYKESRQKPGFDNKHTRKLSNLQHQLEKTPDSMIESDTLMNALLANAFTLSETESLVYNIVENSRKQAFTSDNQATTKIASGVSPQVPNSAIQKIQLAEKLQSLKSRPRSRADVDDRVFHDESRQRSRQPSHVKRLSQDAIRLPSDVDYAYTDRLLEEIHCSENKIKPVKKTKRLSSVDSDYCDLTKGRPKSTAKSHASEKKKQVRSVSPITTKKRQKSTSPLRRMSSVKKLVIR